MKRSATYAKEIIASLRESSESKSDEPFTKKMGEVLKEIAYSEIKIQREKKKTSLTDAQVASMFREARKKFGAVCRKVAISREDILISVMEFDSAVRQLYSPAFVIWYNENVVPKVEDPRELIANETNVKI